MDLKLEDAMAILPDMTCKYVHNCVADYESERFLASAVWGAVFLEAFLVDLLTKLKIKEQGDRDLNALVSRLRQYQKSPPSGGVVVPDGIVKLCEEIQRIRNRLVHYTGLTTESLDRDAASICGHIVSLLSWCAAEIGPLSSDLVLQQNAEADKDGIRVFVSMITPDSHEQAYFREMLFRRLRAIGFNPSGVLPNQFGKMDPIGRVHETLKQCQAAIVIGLERSHAYFLRDKEGTRDEKEATHRKYTSGWLHLETGLAYALGLEVFVLCQNDLCSDGVFDREWFTYHPVEFDTLDLSSPVWSKFFAHLEEWITNRKQQQTVAD